MIRSTRMDAHQAPASQSCELLAAKPVEDSVGSKERQGAKPGDAVKSELIRHLGLRHYA